MQLQGCIIIHVQNKEVFRLFLLGESVLKFYFENRGRQIVGGERFQAIECPLKPLRLWLDG